MSKMRKVYDDDKDNCRQLTLIKTRNVSDTYMPPWCKIQCEWFDLDLWTCDLKINRDHLFIEGNLCAESGIDQVKGSEDIVRTTLGLQTDRPIDSCKIICLLFKRGIKFMYIYRTICFTSFVFQDLQGMVHVSSVEIDNVSAYNNLLQYNDHKTEF